MIQRIQSIYLLLVSLVSGVLIFFVDVWDTATVEVGAIDLLSKADVVFKLVPILFVVTAVMSLFSIFKFQNRKFQIQMGRIIILINLILLGLFIYFLLTLSGEAAVSKKDIGMFLPLVVLLFVGLANRAIKKDEDLVKSVDRLR